MMSTDAPLRILVVDDNAAIHADFRRILCPEPDVDVALDELEREIFAPPQNDAVAREGFQLDFAFQGEEAVAKAAAAVAAGRPYSLAFVDVRMPPGLDGIATIARLWAVDPHLQAVICTAYSDHTWDQIVSSLGHSDGLLVLRKPFDAVEALQIAHAMCRKWRLADQVRRRLESLEAAVGARTRELEVANSRLAEQVEQRARAADEMRHLATHDALTGLPNRLVLTDRIEMALARARRRGTKAAVMLIDLDDFKAVNDVHGHGAGDVVLRRTAERLRGSVRGSDTVTRMGGDEFVVVIDDAASHADIAVLADRIVQACSQPIELPDGDQVRTPASVGVAIFPDDCADPSSLVKAADLAMYQAKESRHRGPCFYASAAGAEVAQVMRLREQLAFAVERGEMELWYQPLVDLERGHIVSFEALVRWQHPELGLVPPMQFIPMAERSGLIVPLGTWVLREACRQVARFRKQGAPYLTVSVNVAARQLQEPGFAAGVLAALAEAQLEPAALELELTETAATGDVETAVAALTPLVARGVRVAIDDFGSGYASFSRLKELPVHTLKIDRSLIRNVATDQRDAVIVAAIVTLGRSLGLSIVAEGIENVEQVTALGHLEAVASGRLVCDLGQGFLFSRPLPVEAAAALLPHAQQLVPARTGT